MRSLKFSWLYSGTIRPMSGNEEMNSTISKMRFANSDA